MFDQLPHQLPWYICGPGIGLLVVGLYAVANKPLGASGAYTQSLSWLRRRPVAEDWRIWYFVGILGGAVVVSLIRGTPPIGLHYGALGAWLPLGALIPLLLVAGTVVGYAARVMGGCTSGHGLCGCSALSPGSFVATGTFVVTGVAMTELLHIVSGGAI